MGTPTYQLSTGSFYGGHYDAKWNGVYLGAVANGFNLNYDIKNVSFETDATGLTVIGAIQTGVDVTIECEVQNWLQSSSTSNALFASIGGVANLMSPLSLVGQDVYNSAQPLIFTPVIAGTNIDPQLMTFNKTAVVEISPIPLNANLRTVRVVIQVFPDRSANMILGTYTAGTV